jgi:SAM-dependent methyltransferase
MRDYADDTYGQRVAGRYDEWFSAVTPGLVDRLSELAEGGKVLELGIGTGRIALPLRERGVALQGIDASPAMISVLRSKPGGEQIPVQIGTFAEFTSKERFSLVFIVFNTIFALTSQQEQISCFQSVARVLEPDGRFLIEAFVPDLDRFDRGQSLRTVGVSMDAVRLECAVHDRASQVVDVQILELTGQDIAFHPLRIRYAWPTELDLMAQLAGLKLNERWGGWDRQPFTSQSSLHVSIYGR